ncbi:hypothetical protein TorRG33x02_153730 [Trema orientale]|uniref:Uncharacterized protein n=1 Tax=Trema orientale TaxID=63057 RepID=A0A2P5ETH9_TREOI|nr:hypothetical protein TorRG33x02_153730 [Trema orientale]
MSRCLLEMPTTTYTTIALLSLVTNYTLSWPTPIRFGSATRTSELTPRWPASMAYRSSAPTGASSSSTTTTRAVMSPLSRCWSTTITIGRSSTHSRESGHR